MKFRLPSIILCVAASLTAAAPAIAYNSEEHKLLVDRGAAAVRIDPSITLPAPTSFGPANPSALLKIHRDAKYLAVGFTTNNPGDYSDQRKGVQDNSYWTGFGQREYNLKIYIPPVADLRDTALVVAGVVAGTQETYTIGELAAIYGDYRRTTYCLDGNCYLTDASTPTLTFNRGTNCFVPVIDCGWRPAPVAMRWYLKYIANGLVPPFGSAGNTFSNTANDDEYYDAGWWGDEMLRIANVNDWHFSRGAVAWYVGMHRLALHYANLARTNNKYWNQALHCEASALHSMTDLFAFGHVVTNRDHTSYQMMSDDGLLNEAAYQWMENVIHMGGGSRDAAGRFALSGSLPAISDAPGGRKDFLPSYAGSWGRWGVQELDFHNAFNGSGAAVRNLKGESYVIYGDGAFKNTPEATRRIIVEAVRTSLQSLFDAYVELERGGDESSIGAAGTPFLAALKSLPIFIESNPTHPYKDHYKITWTTGDNFDGQWTRYAQAVDALAGTDVVPDTSPLPCEIQYVDGDIEFNQLATSATPCTTFPNVTPSHGAPPVAAALEQNYPNPFNPTTAIDFELPHAGFITLDIFDLQGAKIATLVAGNRSAGPNQAFWDGRNASGNHVSSGVYLYQLTFDGKSSTKKLTLVR